MRFIFAISVVIAHVGPLYGFTLIGGKIAVQSFFILSGFYMALILNDKYKKPNGYMLFIRNRILRIYPVYFAVLILTFLFSIYWSTDGLINSFLPYQNDNIRLHPMTMLYLIFQNIVILTQDIGNFFSINQEGLLFFDPHASSTLPFVYQHSLIPQAWTLSIELLFYLLAPLFIRRKTIFIIILLLLSISVRVIIYSLGFHHEPWTNKFFPTELAFFLAGILAFRMYQKKLFFKIKRMEFIIFYIALVLLTLVYDMLPKISGIINPMQLLYFIFFFTITPLIFGFLKNNKLDRFIGELSYPIYISHIFIFLVIRNLNITKNPNTNSLLSIVSTILFSILLYVSIIKPVEKYRKKGIIVIKKPPEKSGGF